MCHRRGSSKVCCQGPGLFFCEGPTIGFLRWSRSSQADQLGLSMPRPNVPVFRLPLAASSTRRTPVPFNQCLSHSAGSTKAVGRDAPNLFLWANSRAIGCDEGKPAHQACLWVSGDGCDARCRLLTLS
jgi:hypothetical protein